MNDLLILILMTKEAERLDFGESLMTRHGFNRVDIVDGQNNKMESGK